MNEKNKGRKNFKNKSSNNLSNPKVSAPVNQKRDSNKELGKTNKTTHVTTVDIGNPKKSFKDKIIHAVKVISAVLLFIFASVGFYWVVIDRNNPKNKKKEIIIATTPSLENVKFNSPEIEYVCKFKKTATLTRCRSPAINSDQSIIIHKQIIIARIMNIISKRSTLTAYF